MKTSKRFLYFIVSIICFSSLSPALCFRSWALVLTELPFTSQHKSWTAVARKRETFKREAIFRTKPPFHAVNAHTDRQTPSSHFPLHPALSFNLSFSPSIHPPPCPPPSIILCLLPLCSPAQTQTATVSAVVKDWNMFLVATRHKNWQQLASYPISVRLVVTENGVCGPQRVLERLWRVHRK